MINGFDIRKLKQMEGMDGYVTSCELLYEGRKLGDYFDAGNGGMYEFSPWRMEKRINDFLKEFPRIEDKYFGDINWDIGILVEELINQKEAKRLLKTVAPTKGAVVLIKADMSYYIYTFWLSIRGDHSDAELRKIADRETQKQNCKVESIEIYRTESDIDKDFGLSFNENLSEDVHRTETMESNVITDTAYIVRMVDHDDYPEDMYFFDYDKAKEYYDLIDENDAELYSSKHLIREEHLTRGYVELELESEYFDYEP